MSDTGLSWEKLIDAVRTDMPQLYRSWFETLPTGEFVNGEFRIAVSDPHQQAYLSGECSEAFTNAIMRMTGRLVPVQFGEVPRAAQAVVATSLPKMPVAPLNPDHTFEQFVVGPSNRLAHAACRAVCAQPGIPYNPLFIHGGPGLGKTHLLQAIAAELGRGPQPLNVIYFSCETFVNELVRAIEKGSRIEFRDSIRAADALVLDDIQFIADRPSSQEELFHTFNVLHQFRRQIVLSADSPPGEIPKLEDRLVSRFNWGLVTSLDQPDRETRHAILQKKARLRGAEIPDDVLDFIAEQVQSNIRVLEGALTKLVYETKVGGRSLTVETAADVIGHYQGTSSKPLQVSEILDAVSKYYNVRLPDLIGRKRARSQSFPRQVGMYLARRLTPLSLEEIGGYFGGRDHSTVLHAEKVVETACEHEQQAAAAVTTLTQQLLARK